MSLLRAESGYVQSPDVADEQVAAPVRGNNDFVRVRDARGAGWQREPRLPPYTVSLAFSMAYGGARGGTEAQMAQTPNFLPQEGQHPTFDALDRRASRSESEEGDSGTPVRLNVANAARRQRPLLGMARPDLGRRAAPPALRRRCGDGTGRASRGEGKRNERVLQGPRRLAAGIHLVRGRLRLAEAGRGNP